ncbi:MAG: cyclic-di-AMP receptor [Anaerolineae bacterium]|nr:cyclic-di-AMP receptor [Anaerolineae bacterium]
MKLIQAIVHNDDADAVINALLAQSFRATRMASTGGFLRAGNTTIVSGVEEEQVDEVLNIIKQHVKSRLYTPARPKAKEVEVSGAIVFVINVERLERL